MIAKGKRTNSARAEATRPHFRQAIIGATIALVATLIIAAAGGLFLITKAGVTSQANCSTTAPVISPETVQISIYSGAASPSNKLGFSPDSITLVIGVNSTVTWTNDDHAPHTVTSTSAPDCLVFGSGNMNHGETYTIAFGTPGTYHYRCDYHGWMTGTIVVKEPWGAGANNW